jgi:hypothetical protein
MRSLFIALIRIAKNPQHTPFGGRMDDDTGWKVRRLLLPGASGGR